MLKHNIIKYFAKKHIAGSSLNDALKICRWANQKNWFTTISVWTDEKENPESAALKYSEIITAITVEGFDSYLSIKPSALNFNLKLFARIAESAQVKNIRIHFDSLSPDLADKSLKFLREAKSIYTNVGFTLASRWNLSLHAAEEMIKLQIPVRIVKGQWADVDNSKIDSRKNYLTLIKMLSGKVPLIAVATHDIKLAKNAFDLLLKEKNNFEFEQFFSLPLNGIGLSKSVNSKFGLYVAYGTPYLPYSLNNANKRPAMFLWLLRDVLNIKQKYVLESSLASAKIELRDETS